MHHFLLVVCSNDVSVLRRFRDITVYVAVCDYEKSLIQLKLQVLPDSRLKPRSLCMRYGLRGMGVRKVSVPKLNIKVTQGHLYWCHSICRMISRSSIDNLYSPKHNRSHTNRKINRKENLTLIMSALSQRYEEQYYPL